MTDELPEEPKEVGGGLWSAPFGTIADPLTAWVGYATVLRSALDGYGYGYGYGSGS